MSIKGSAESNVLRGRVADPDKIHGLSAYELDVMYGKFDGTLDEWLKVVRGDFDERVEEAKAEFDNEVDTVIVPEAKVELESAKDSAVAEIADAETNSLKVLGNYTNSSIGDLKRAAAVADEKEVLLWENPTPSTEFTSGTISIDYNSIEGIDGIGDIDSLRVVFLTRTIGNVVLPSVQVKLGQSGNIHFAEGSNTAKAYSRTFLVHSTGNIQFEGADPNNAVCIPYRIYGVKNNEINLDDLKKGATETVTDIHRGKNIISAFTWIEGKRFDDSGNILDDASQSISDFFPMKINESIAMSYTLDGVRKGAPIRRVLAYDANKNLIGLFIANVTGFTLTDENTHYVRLQLTALASNLIDLQAEYADDRTAYEAPYEIRTLSQKQSVQMARDFELSDIRRLQHAVYCSDFTIIDDLICFFTPSNGTTSGKGSIYIYKFDLETNQIGRVADHKHNFGHCNTVDYCAENDCLIFGNGSGEYGIEGKFYIVPNARKVISANDIVLSDVAIEFDGTGLDFGDKWNVCWGYENYGSYNIAVLITNDNRDIRLLKLGKGANALDYGTLLSGKTEDEYNGTFSVLGHCVLDDGRTSITNSDNCNQGSDWYNGRLYVNVGHRCDRYWIIKPNFSTGVADYEEVYRVCADGLTTSPCGICVTRRYIILNRYMDGQDVGYMTFIER